jgi:multicomponent Na+:H+ antiporter subunit G
VDVILEIIGWVTMVAGGAFVLIGGIGVLRFPDMYTRLHAASVTETLGAGLLLFGMLLHAGSWLVAVKLILLGLFLFATSPTSAHALARTALEGGLKPRLWGANPRTSDDEPGPDETPTEVRGGANQEDVPSKP